MGDRQSGLSRRDFLGSAAVATLAVAGASGLTGCAQSTSGATYAWDKETDFVVAGGGTGMAGALAAAVSGMSVVLLEKRNALGGAMALSGGVAWLPNSEYSQATGDSRELALTYLHHMQMEAPNEDVTVAFVDNTQNAIETLAAGGVELLPWYPVEYHTDWEGALNTGGRSTMVADENGELSTAGGGGRLGQVLMSALENLGVEVLLETPAVRLVTRRGDSDSVPEVIGVVAQDSQGNEIRIRANKGVLLATGGFEWDETLKANYLRTPNPYTVSYNSNTGDALRMVQALGADLRLMKETFGMAVYTEHGKYAKEQGVPCAIALQTERSLPGAILVDSNGRRFCNEASDYDSQSNTFGGYNNFGDNGYSAEVSWIVCDSTCYSTYGLGKGQDSGFPVPEIAEEKFLTVGDTLTALAEKLGLNPEVLAATVEEFNAYAREGRDPVFHRGETFKPLSRIRDTLAPLETPPYYAASVSNGCLGTIGGPRLNGNAEVVHVSGEPVKRLYACGNCAGVGAPGTAYGGAGGTIGPAFVMGTIAAQHATTLDAWV